MTFSFCATTRPQYHPLSAKRIADSRRQRFPDVLALACPFNPGDHWHVVDSADDPLVVQAEALRAQRLEWLRAFDEDRAMRSEAMADGFRHSGM